ncbi:transposase [candidate division KSB1 bacterium]|nr:transposase [candidate division KSB1 bacterium]
MSLIIKKYEHAPTHWFLNDSFYFFTGAVYQKKRYLSTSEARAIFLKYLFQFISKYHWELIEWVVLENHYHFLAKVIEAADIPRFINTLHKTSAFHIKKLLDLDVAPFWYQYWDSCIRNETHYFETATYILYNPVKHGYVENLNDYAHSSFHIRKKEEEEKLRKAFLQYKPGTITYYNDIDDF